MKKQCIECFKNLSIRSRMDIYRYVVNNGKANVNEITKHVNLRQPTVSYHLKAMKDSGLLFKINAGRQVYYSVSYNCPHDEQKCFLL